jgi:hypothetical protein
MTRAGSRPASIALACAAAVVVAALVQDELSASAAWAALLCVVVLALPPAAALGVILVAAHLPALLVGDAFGSVSPVDTMLLALVLRAALARPTLPPGWRRDPAVYGAALFLAAGLVGTAISPHGSAVTAYLRVAGYIGAAAVAYAALDEPGRRSVLAALVGVALGDSIAALAGITDTVGTGLPLGRYLGTLGDPGQFGIPVAVALAAVALAPWLFRHRVVRIAAGAVLVVALFGSNTRAAWGGALVAAITVLAVALARRGVRSGARFAAGAVLGVAAVTAAAAVTIWADRFGFGTGSARVRIDSLSLAWDYFVGRPLHPTGLGNLPGQFPAYNTWLAMALALGVAAAAGLAVFVGAALRRATRLATPEWLAVSVVFLAATMTENMVFAGSSMTLSWFVVCGVVAGQPVTASRKSGATRVTA